MNAAGFTDVEVIDVTEAFLEVAGAWQSEFLRHERELREVIGDEWEKRLSDRADMIRGVEQGLLRRVLVTGKAPESRGNPLKPPIRRQLTSSCWQV
jgi:hypothetical protein